MVEVNRRRSSLRFAHVGPSRSLRLGERVRVTARLGAGLAWVDTRDDWPSAPPAGGPDRTESSHPLLLLGADLAVRPFPGVEAVLDVRELIHECDGEGLCPADTDRLDHTVVSAGLRLGMP